jgi:O-acetyl-ADP-ribose deacetylase (regulator of RNase III)
VIKTIWGNYRNRNLNVYFFFTVQAVGWSVEDDIMANKRDEEVKRIFKQNMKSLGDDQKEEGKYSLCFPSISTSVYKYDINRAAKVTTRVIKEFFNKYPDIDVRLYLVDIQESATLETFKKQRDSEELTDPRYIIQRANITLLRDYGIPSCYIVNASNPSFHGRGSGTNRAIHTAASSGVYNLEKETRKLYSKNAKTAKAYPVDLRDGSPLKDFQGVKTVIHVVGPNMSPKRPRYLEQNYEFGDKLLKRAYESILSTFLKLTKLEVPVDDTISESDADVPQITVHRQKKKLKKKIT